MLVPLDGSTVRQKLGSVVPLHAVDGVTGVAAAAAVSERAPTNSRDSESTRMAGSAVVARMSAAMFAWLVRGLWISNLLMSECVCVHSFELEVMRWSHGPSLVRSFYNVDPRASW